ncbi:hypothetical protein [Streptomyces sp. 3213.3]|nr:hypothetical protein [Streptomyces sp. 3213.3]
MGIRAPSTTSPAPRTPDQLELVIDYLTFSRDGRPPVTGAARPGGGAAR